MSDHAKPDGMTEDYDGEICSEYKNVKLDDVPLEFFGLMLKLGWLEIKDIPKNCSVQQMLQCTCSDGNVASC